MFTSSVTAFSDKTSLFPASFATDNPSFVTEDSREGVNKALEYTQASVLADSHCCLGCTERKPSALKTKLQKKLI